MAKVNILYFEQVVQTHEKGWKGREKLIDSMVPQKKEGERVEGKNCLCV